MLMNVKIGLVLLLAVMPLVDSRGFSERM